MVSATGSGVQPITPAIAALAAGLPDDFPRDLADRLIGATAIAEGLTLLTADESLQRSPLVRTLW